MTRRGQRPLPQQLAQATIGARVWWERACPRCSLERSPRPASAPSRPEAAPTKARPNRHRSPGFGESRLARDAASNEARGMPRPHRGQRLLPQELARTGIGARGLVGAGLPAMQPRTKPAARISRIAARGCSHKNSPEPASEPGVWWERACPRCSRERGPRRAQAASRPEAAPTKARPNRHRSRGLVGAGLPAMQPRTRPTACSGRVAARGRSHKSSPEPPSEPGSGGSGLARDAASNEARGMLRPHRGQRPLPPVLAQAAIGGRGEGELPCVSCSRSARLPARSRASRRRRSGSGRTNRRPVPGRCRPGRSHGSGGW